MTTYNSNYTLDPRGLASVRQQAQAGGTANNEKVAKQFEGMFLSMMLKGMRDTLPKDGMTQSDETRMAQGMADDQMAQTLAAGKGVGLAAVLTQQLNRSATSVAPGIGTQAISLHAAEQAALPFKSMDIAGLAFHRAQAASRAYSLHATALNAAAGASSAPASAATSAPASELHQKFVDNCEGAAQEASEASGIPAKAILGQAALESGWGQHEVKDAKGNASYNLFGIKADSSWTGKTVSAMTTEYVDGVAHRVMQKFRAYASYAESFTDYAKMIANNPRYAKVMEVAHDALSFAHAMGHSGYATDPDYGKKLAQVISGPLSKIG